MEPEPSRRATIAVAIAVFAAAVALRMPSCYESLWLDELHSAWTVWGDLGEVISRAERGHQSPVYFLGLWFWKQACGESELALRMSSVLAVAFSSVVLTVGVTRWTTSLAAGTAAGLVLAIENNSLFFGTELRPYAFVILFASMAVVFFLRLVLTRSRHDHRLAWSGLVVTILLATLCQPTAIGVLAFLPATLWVVWLWRSRGQVFQFSLLDGLLAITATGILFSLWIMTLSESWGQRENWASFAKATRVAEIWKIWDWTWLLIVPLALLGIQIVHDRFRKQPWGEWIAGTLLLAMITVAATSLYWFVSRAELFPVWHRRYFVAVLPMFACVAGGCVGIAASSWRSNGKRVVAGTVMTATIVIGLAAQQGTLRRLPDYPVALVARGENWPGAIAWVKSRVQPKDEIFLDSGLIEAASLFDRLLSEVPPSQLEYFLFPTSGPYELRQGITPIPPGVVIPGSANRRVFILTRRSANRIDRLPLPDASQVIGFGNVSVIVTQPEPERK